MIKVLANIIRKICASPVLAAILLFALYFSDIGVFNTPLELVLSVLLAYGSNLNRNQMRMRCPGAKPLGTAVIEGYRLLFKGSKTGAYLTIEPAEGHYVPVAVWQVTEDDEKALDRYEGYPTFYYKTDINVTYHGILSNMIRTCRAFVYIMHEDRAIGVPSTYYVSTCLQGYRDFGFDERLLLDAYEHSIKEAKDEN